MDWTEMPSLNSLRAFSAVAEAGSYSQAAKRLNVTHAALIQQVKALEARLGACLVIRAGRGISLTRDGARLAHDLETGFSTIRRGVAAVAETDGLRPVQITTSPAFAVEWLMPRIPEFQQNHPEITLMLNPTAEIMELTPGGIDLAIRYTDARRLEKKVTPILVSDMIVIGTPSLIGIQESDDPARLKSLPWLQELGTHEVADWFERRGVALDGPLAITQMPGNLIMQGVRRGDGISYTARAFFQEEIRSGQVVVLASDAAFGTYYLETSHGAMRPAVETFVTWLKSKAETVTVGAHPARSPA